ncbi:MAG: DEAD/DEAH box helicase, partial [Desulfobacteraceae bacterium]
VIRNCSCDNGCPACVHSPKCGSGNRPIDKASSLRILDLIMHGGPSHQIEVPQTPVQPVMEVRSEYAVLTDNQNQAMRFGVLDIETRKSAADVGGWQNAHKMEMSCAVLYDSAADSFITYLQEDMDTLVSDLQEYDLIIGFNIVRFDYKVLSGLSRFKFSTLPTLDLLLKVHERLGYRLSLDHLAQNTLGAQKSADGLQALEWWKEGKLDLIIEYCTQDVRVTRDLYLFGKKNQYLLFKNKAGMKVRVPVNW